MTEQKDKCPDMVKIAKSNAVGIGLIPPDRPDKEKLRRLCAWCKKDLDTGKQLTDSEYKALENTATRGMCKECYQREQS